MPFNADNAKLPPYTNGVMELTEAEILLVKERLDGVAEDFVPDDYYPEIDTSYLTVEYNKIYTKERINGDTCEMVLSYQPQEVTPEEPVEEPAPTEPAQEETQGE
jgi:hypothetical protein